MSADRLFNRIRIAAADRNHQRRSILPGLRDHNPVALREPIARERQTPEPVGSEAIDSGLEENKLRGKPPDLGKRAFESIEIFIVLRPVLQFYIENTLLFSKREVTRTMNREREDGDIVLKDRGCSIALVNIQVDHCEALQSCMRLGPGDRDSDIVKHAESGSFTAKRMMCPAGERSTEAGFDCGSGRKQSSARARQCSRHQFGRPRKTDAPHRLCWQPAFKEFVDVCLVVNLE